MCCSLNLNSVTGIPTISQIRRSVNLSNFAQSRIRYCWLEWMTSVIVVRQKDERNRGNPPPCKKILIGFAHISGVALEESGWVQTHPNPPVASPLNIIIYYYLVPCRLSTDPKIRDLVWLWIAWMAILRCMFTTTNCHGSLFVAYLVSFVYYTWREERTSAGSRA